MDETKKRAAIAWTEETARMFWTQVMERLRAVLQRQVYENWFVPLAPVAGVEGMLELVAPDAFFRDWVDEHFLPLITEHVHAVAGTAVRIAVRVQTAVPAPAATFRRSASAKQSHGRQEGVARAGVFGTVLPSCTFSSFVTGPSNEFAHAVCVGVAQSPASAYNPLFVHGQTGLGKTHLLHAIAHETHKLHPNLRIFVMSGDLFVHEFVQASRQNSLDDFWRHYREDCDVLLLDDIQQIAGKKGSQNAFFDVFNTLHGARKQIVITADRIPAEIEELQDRIRSRFQWGVIAQVNPPPMATRIDILRSKAKDRGYQIDDKIAGVIAQLVRSNVRDLEGALVSVEAHSRLQGKPMTKELVERVLSGIVPVVQARLTVGAIQEHVAGYYHLKVEEMCSKRRHRDVALARQVAMFLCRKHLALSLPEIARRFGKRDHTTVLASIRRIETLCSGDVAFANVITHLERGIQDLAIT